MASTIRQTVSFFQPLFFQSGQNVVPLVLGWKAINLQSFILGLTSRDGLLHGELGIAGVPIFHLLFVVGIVMVLSFCCCD